MATWSDGGRSGVINFSSMRQPPLIKQLKGILSEYPDGGQILKELIQNAEDADATIVEIEYDSRRINDEKNETTQEYTKFFKGPALCVYNDAVFTDNDWDGIRMIYSSVKEDDRLKVGRFGLGFKSVFHITDYPCVLSGNQLLMIDPQQPSDRVNAMVSLANIEQLNDKGLSEGAFWSAFNNKFGFTQVSVKEGYFKGTIFWFPLREIKSELSETLYNEEKVFDLFDDFRSDSSSILVFLKNLKRISLGIVKENNCSEMIASVEILDENNKVEKSRRKFKRRLADVDRQYKGDDIVHEVQMKIRTKTKDNSVDTDWVVVNYYVGNSASVEFRKLIEDENIGYSPYVGVATPISQDFVERFEGHVFCFLPLPKEGSKLTGLPVHVNGYFALSQNRHHLKQETDEQQGKRIDDKTILWNQNLIKDAIPRAYCRLILFIIGISNNSGNPSSMVRMIYDSLPLKPKTLSRWQRLEDELFKKLKTLKVFYSEHSNTWITVTDACFATFSSLPDNCKHITPAVQRCMNQIGLRYVEIPLKTLETVKHHFNKISDITPDMLVGYLRKHHAYKRMDSSDKIDLLLYLLSENRYHHLVNGLELLPLASGAWRTFNSQGPTVYICSQEVVDILQGMENNLVKKEIELGQVLSSKLTQLCGKDYCQLKNLCVTDMVILVDKSLEKLLGSKHNRQITNLSKLSIEWLKSLWEYIIRDHCFDEFINLQIVPKLIQGTWDCPLRIDLVRLSDKVLVKANSEHILSDNVVRCFEKMGVTVIDSLPDWILKGIPKNYFFWPSGKGIIKLLEVLYHNTNWLEKINCCHQTWTISERNALVLFLSKCSHLLNDETRKLLQHFPIFRMVRCIDGEISYSSLYQTREFVIESIDYPKDVALPFPCCLSDTGMEQLMKEIGGNRIDLDQLVLAKLRNITKTKDKGDGPKFMEYFINNFNLFRMNDDMIEYASNVPFLRTGTTRRKPADLFDPSDTSLLHLLHGEFLLPETKKKLNMEKIRILRLLGLRTSDDIDKKILLQVAKSLDMWSKQNTENEHYLLKAFAFKNALHQNQSLLMNDHSFRECVKHLECIPIDLKRHPNYPTCLPWYQHDHFLAKPAEIKEASMCLLVGSVQSTVSCSLETLNNLFGWKIPPEIHVVIDQLRTVKQNYSVHVRPDLMSSIKALYDHLASRIGDMQPLWVKIMNEELIWTGDSFVAAEKVTVKKMRNDLDLTPYIRSLPIEFECYNDLFLRFGCRNDQNINVLLDTLCLIQSTHVTVQEEHIVKRDKHLVCRILDRIAELKERGIVIDSEKILMMVHDSDKSVLKLCPLTDCVYDDDPEYAYEDTGNMHLVHEMISNDTTEALGVKSITRKALSDAEGLGIEACGQQEPLTTRINSLLREGYTDGLSVPKELIQNADDAGATTIKFLYDERQNLNARQRVFSREMKQFQGPALWVFNDAQFSKEDFKNITKLNGATKQSDVNKIGKFGLGFCSVYNLTDIPSFLSGNNLVMFDPHETHLGNILSRKNAGLKYELPNKTLVGRHADQFKPFSGIFNCHILEESFKSYEGTLFRLPLRTEKQARESKICSKAYTDTEMKELLQMLITNAGNFLLFSQNISCIEVYHLPEKDETVEGIRLIHQLNKKAYKLDRGKQVVLENCVLSRMSGILQNNIAFTETHISIIKQNLETAARELIFGLDKVLDRCETPWIISWAKGNDSSLRLYKHLTSEGAVPLAAVAIPCTSSRLFNPVSMEVDLPTGFYNKSHVFCFLPLPIKTELKVHINGCFAITSDRRQLLALSEDDKSSQRHSWNKCLMEDAVVSAYVTLLKTIAENNNDETYKYYSLWPSHCSRLTESFEAAFYRTLICKHNTLFKGCGKWIAFNDACFLHPTIRRSDIGDIALEFLYQYLPYEKYGIMIDIPEHILQHIKEHNKNKEKTISSKEIVPKMLYKMFLTHINSTFWTSRTMERNKFLIYALKSNDRDVTKMIQNLDCIPTEPYQRLRKPSDLVSPTSSIAEMFATEEEVFPLKIVDFQKPDVLRTLIALGMCDNTLPKKLLQNRCCSVEELARTCCVCACNRSQVLMQYMSQKDVLEQLKADSEILNVVSNAYILPVMSKPKDWAFSWKADKDLSNTKQFKESMCDKHSGQNKCLILGKPNSLYLAAAMDYVGTTCLILNENLTYGTKGYMYRKQELFTLISLRGFHEIPVEVFVEQILNLANEYHDKKSQLNELQRLHGKLFTHFEKIIDKLEPNQERLLDPMFIVPVVLIGDELVEVRKVAFEVIHECKPFLYKLPSYDKVSKSRVYSKIGVRDYFNFETIIETMELVGCIEGKQGEVDVVNNLLVNLQDSLNRNEKTYHELVSFHDRILAPDTQGTLWPTRDLVIENNDFQTNVSMKILHSSIAPKLGEELGVVVKKLKCYKSISFAVSFGQSENLVTRIQGLLQAYPCDSSIMKELLQNADDAGATEIYFVKDYRTHTSKQLFADTCKQLQGPSLCVYNNSFFTKDDIEGIHNLGKGSKRDDPTRTGQYGVGFNAVYHLTDTPSFVTVGPDDNEGGDFFIFDPLLKHVPDANTAEPGMRCKVHDVEINFPEHMLGFSVKKLIKSGKGTIFRFPLRKYPSKISNNVLNQCGMDTILRCFKDDMMETMLFLKNISCIKILDITSGDLCEEYSVKIQCEECVHAQRRQFNQKVCLKTTEQLGSKMGLIEIHPFQSVYHMNVVNSESVSKSWIIAQQFGILPGNDRHDLIKESFRNGDLGLLPTGGVAIPFEVCEQTNAGNASFVGKAFCFLPLPIHTGLPVHINGHFALDHESRRELWKDGYRGDWNKFLAETVIVPAWVSGISHIRGLINPKIEDAKTWRSVNELTLTYYSIFPDLQTSTADYWKHVTLQFYHHVVTNRDDIFVCIEKKDDRSLVFSTKWTIVNPIDDKSFYGVYNNIFETMSHIKSYQDREKESRLITHLLKSFGMKLLDMPHKIKMNLEKAGIKSLKSADPQTVVSFMKTFGDYFEKSCDIGNVDVDIAQTKFSSPQNLQSLVMYIALDAHNYDTLEGLPIVLTADGVLHVCSDENSVFVSQHATLLPASSHLFLHEDICNALSDHSKLCSATGFKCFEFQDFVELLPKSKLPTIFRNGCELAFETCEDAASSSHVSVQWLRLFYDFLCKNSKEMEIIPKPLSRTLGEAKGRMKISIEKLTKNMESLHQWSFLLCKRSTEFILIPFEKKNCILHLSYSQRQDALGKILNELPIPRIDEDLFRNHPEPDLKKAILKCIPSVDQPHHLLECLLHHHDAIKISQSLTVENGTEVLSFFLRHIDSLTMKDPLKDLNSKLKRLPFYVTQQGTMTDIASCEKVLIVPKDMPMDGIQQWADQCSITLLQENETLSKLHKYLKLKVADILEIYGEEILPKNHALPNECLLTHITFLRDKLRGMFTNMSKHGKIYNALKNIPFVLVNGAVRRVNDLYDPNTLIFKYMLNENNFIPAEFLTDEWASFLDNLGLIRKVNDDIVIEFAQRIEIQGRKGINNDIQQKSDALVSCLTENRDSNCTRDNMTLSRLKSIRFIVPFCVDTEKSKIASPLNNRDYLICFKDTVSSAKLDLCWSSSSLIHCDILNKLTLKVKCGLGILDDPPLSSVTLHCENVCRYLEGNIKDMDADFVKQQMLCFYEYFTKFALKDPKILSQLNAFPFIHLPEENNIVLANDIVIELNTDSEIKPYLYRAPTFYGQYHELFALAGCKRKCSFCQYARILEKIHSVCDDNAMNLPEKKAVQKALKGLLSINIDEDESKDDVDVLYLPTDQMYIKRSSEIIFSDNIWYEHCLQGLVELDLFAGPRFLESNSYNFEKIFMKWPEQLRPIYLTSIVTEELSFLTDHIQKCEESVLAQTIKTFLCSPELVTALCRLLKHQSSYSSTDTEYDCPSFEAQTAKCLGSVQIYAMQTLRTTLKFRGKNIYGSEREIQYYIQHNANNAPCAFYFMDSGRHPDDTRLFSEGLVHLIQQCTEYRLDHHSFIHIASLVKCIDSPNRLYEILDRVHISSHESSLIVRREYFPRPGTYVEKDFIPFLEQGIIPFQPHEYEEVAMELDDIPDDANSTLFIYVKIVGVETKPEFLNSNLSGNMAIVYLVNTRNGTSLERVPIFRLYRFVRKIMSTCLELDVVENVPEPTMSIDEQCKQLKKELIEAWKLPESDRKRIVRRILLKWHPDKNRGNEEYCTEVFKYIQIIISRLESGEIILNDVQEEMSRGPSNFSRSSSDFYENVNRRAKAYASAYYDNYEEYSRSGRKGRYSHTSHTVVKRQDIPEAKRWFRQATHDFHTAEVCFSAVEATNSFNWICNICLHACENALLAALFYHDADDVRTSRNLDVTDIPAATPAMSDLVNRLARRIGDHSRLTLPDALSRPHIPSDILTNADAAFALDVTRELLQLVSDYIT